MPASIPREGVSPDKFRGDAMGDGGLESVSEGAAAKKPSVPVIGEGRVARQRIGQIGSPEPAIGGLAMQSPAQVPKGSDAPGKNDDQLPDRPLKIDRRSARRAPERLQTRACVVEVGNGSTDRRKRSGGARSSIANRVVAAPLPACGVPLRLGEEAARRSHHVWRQAHSRMAGCRGEC